MTTERLSDLVIIAMNENAVTINRSVVCEKFVAPLPRRMTASSLLANYVIKDNLKLINVWFADRLFSSQPPLENPGTALDNSYACKNLMHFVERFADSFLLVGFDEGEPEVCFHFEVHKLYCMLVLICYIFR